MTILRRQADVAAEGSPWLTYAPVAAALSVILINSARLWVRSMVRYSEVEAARLAGVLNVAGAVKDDAGPSPEEIEKTATRRP